MKKLITLIILTTCIIGTVTGIKHINGVTIAVLNANYIGKSLDGR